jgi:glycosyltransferase involved in cell wall biosynthesis
VAHSDAMKLLYRYYYPSQTGKIHSTVVWFAEWIYREALKCSSFRLPFTERDIDVLFAASAWSRPEKNYGLVKAITCRLRRASIHVVGGAEDRLPHAIYHGFVADGAEFLKLMGRAKTVVCPSVFDAAPGILFQASAMGCNVIASKNCGNWRICNRQLLADSCDPGQFVQMITRSLNAEYQNNMEHFLAMRSYQHLLELISVI